MPRSGRSASPGTSIGAPEPCTEIGRTRLAIQSRRARRRQVRGIPHRRPEETARLVGEAAHRVPRAARLGLHSEVEPAVPRKVLELDRAQEDGRAEPGLGVVGDVLHAVGVLGAVRLSLQRVPEGHARAALGEERHQPALGAHPLHGPGQVAAGPAGQHLVDLSPHRRVADRALQQQIAVEPALLHPRRPRPAVESRDVVRTSRSRNGISSSTASASASTTLTPDARSASASLPFARTRGAPPGPVVIEPLASGAGEIDVADVVAVIRRHRVRVDDRVGLGPGEGPGHACGARAARCGIPIGAGRPARRSGRARTRTRAHR